MSPALRGRTLSDPRPACRQVCDRQGAMGLHSCGMPATGWDTIASEKSLVFESSLQ